MSVKDLKQLDKIRELQTELKILELTKEKESVEGKSLAIGLGGIALGGLALATGLPLTVGLGLGMIGLIGGGFGMIDKKYDEKQVAITSEKLANEKFNTNLIDKSVYGSDLKDVDLDLLRKAKNLFEHIPISNSYGDVPTYEKHLKNEKVYTFIYDLPFGIIDEDIDKYQERIARMLGSMRVDIEVKNNQLKIKYRESVDFKDLYTYEPIYFPKETNFHALIGMVEKDGQVVPYAFDFSVEPHMLLAGVTGKGKSTILNCLIINLLVNYTPQELQMYLIDFKGGVEFDSFEDVKHVHEVIWEKDRFKAFLKSLEEQEVPRREKLLKSKRAKNLFGYNEKSKDKMPFLLIVLDEFAQLSPTEDKDIIEQLIRLTPKTRFLGIYFIIATQRPSADIITNNIKTNLCNVVGLGTNSVHDTKVIFGENEVALDKIKGKGKGYFRANAEYVYFQGFYLGVNPSDKSEQERTIAKILKDYNLLIEKNEEVPK